MLHLTAEQREAIIAHARAEAPLEACGLLAGTDGCVQQLYRLANSEQGPLSYRLDPLEQLRAFEDMEAQGWELLAIYHSHPASPAYPSPRDVDLAYYPDAVYVIVSLLDPARPVLRGFRIVEGRVSEEEIAMAGISSGAAPSAT
jgi:proteasome lid subunit RPN8/RPN11